MKNIALILQIIVSLFLIACISIQVKGGGLGKSFTAGSFTRRGLEKLVFRLTFVLVALFIASSIFQFFGF